LLADEVGFELPGGDIVGAVTRKKEIRQRRTRRRKRRRAQLRELARALQKGRAHSDRVRIAEEVREKWASRRTQA
jgi:hypothetical protein